MRAWRIVLMVVVCVVWPAAGWGQLAPVQLEPVEPGYAGLGGLVRPGGWAPVRLALRYAGSQPRAVVCRWVLEDYDGDIVYAQRAIVLSPGRDVIHTWLYAPVPVDMRAGQPYLIEVVDPADGRQLAKQPLVWPLERVVQPEVAVIGMLSGPDMGLRSNAYLTAGGSERDLTRVAQHEEVRLATGLNLATLPDRWYGLSGADTLVWSTLGGGDPNDPAIGFPMQRALREWIERGGHLVIVMPAVGEPWSGSELADLLPVSADRMRRVQTPPPLALGSPLGDEIVELNYTVFDVKPGEGGAEIVLRAGQNRPGDPPLAVAKRHGFGRVTLIGVDLTSSAVRQMRLPNGKFPLWNQVLGWQTPVMTRAFVEGEVQKQQMTMPNARDTVSLGAWVPSLIAMRNAAGPAMLLAILLFGLYWLAAGWGSWALLKSRGMVRHAWVAFIAVVAVFSLAAWGGAAALRPRGTSISHFSVLDADGNTGQSRVRSYLSLYVPSFGAAEVAIDPAPAGDAAPAGAANPDTGGSTLSAAGLVRSLERPAFPDRRAYALDAARPDGAAFPVRATAKQMSLDWRGRLDAEHPGLAEPFTMPRGRVALENGFPAGELTHGLPGTLTGVTFIFCPGDGQTPWAWRHPDDWPPETILTLQNPLPPTVPRSRLVVGFPAAMIDTPQRTWAKEGFLGQLIGLRAGQTITDQDLLNLTPRDNEIIQEVEMLSFFRTLPPPNYRQIGFMQGMAAQYQRALGPGWDLTHLTAGRRLIMLGHLTDSTLPAPLAVDGRTIDSSGRTVVRWVYDF